MYCVGLDVHQLRTSVCVLDPQGNIFRQWEVKGASDVVVDSLRRLGQPFKVCYEASTGYGVLYEQLMQVATHVQVAHPGRLRLIFKSKKKHNRADAQKLASLLHLNQVPQVHVPAADVRSWRGLIEHRRSLVDQCVRQKNQIRALLRGCGMPGLPGKAQWTHAGMEQLRERAWPSAVEKLRITLLLEQIAELQQRVRRVTEALDEFAQRHAGVALLMTIPGIGPRTAEAFVAYVDDPHRFRCGTIGAYFGLVPLEDSTGNHRRLGHITREGPATVRKLLTEAVWQGVRQSWQIRQVYERFVRGDRERRKIALVAVSHWLARVMLAMLKSGEVFRELPEPVAPEACGVVPAKS